MSVSFFMETLLKDSPYLSECLALVEDLDLIPLDSPEARFERDSFAQYLERERQILDSPVYSDLLDRMYLLNKKWSRLDHGGSIECQLSLF